MPAAREAAGVVSEESSNFRASPLNAKTGQSRDREGKWTTQCEARGAKNTSHFGGERPGTSASVLRAEPVGGASVPLVLDPPAGHRPGRRRSQHEDGVGERSLTRAVRGPSTQDTPGPQGHCLWTRAEPPGGDAGRAAVVQPAEATTTAYFLSFREVTWMYRLMPGMDGSRRCASRRSSWASRYNLRW